MGFITEFHGPDVRGKQGNRERYDHYYRVEAIRQFPRPKCVRDVRSILGAAGFYRRFCPSYSEVVESLINLTRKNIRDNTDDEENIPLAELQKHLRNKQFADIQSSSSESDTMHYNNGNSQNSPVRRFENDSSDDQMQIDAGNKAIEKNTIM
ncbi:hypothetical protein DPMN_028373 [Dreissena polymorpha]|uniref:Uncharacterized protein n=1 Tax=Dreissena polymorpha TaxID=45954 RepID=A0A9D4REI1_DREPO|nr:hypothetical protein DPMN_028373 [Dreissena polymorpha]